MRLRRSPWVSCRWPLLGACALGLCSAATLTAEETPLLPPPTASAEVADESLEDNASRDAEPGLLSPLKGQTDIPAPDGDADSAHETADSEGWTVEITDQPTIEPARFNGIQAGATSLTELTAAWGEAEETVSLDEGPRRLRFSQDPFDRVEVHVTGERVESIVVFLAQRFPADALARQLDLAELSSVVVRDSRGVALGEAYPERGVVFHFPADATGRQVSQVMLEPVDAHAFVLRAEEHFGRDYHQTLSDVAIALRLNAEMAPAHWLRARVLADLGRPAAAMSACQAAVRIDEENAEFRFTLAELLATTGDFAAASAQTNQGIVLAGERDELQALGLLQLGDQIAGGPDRDYRRAAEYHMRAIQLAEPLTSDPRPKVRRLAFDILVDAHLAVAQDIAWGHWRQKEKAVPKWLLRAETIATRGIEAGDADNQTLLRVIAGALAAHAGLDGSLDPARWVEQLRRVSTEEIDRATDRHVQNRLRWEVGVALYDTMQTYHHRAEHDKALQFGTAAVKFLETAEEGREATAADGYLMGRLYFRVGSIHAIQQNDHAQAIAWFSKAAPLLSQAVPKSALADVGRQGESLVSMAVSFWEQSQRDEAVELTERGVRLMEQAVTDGILGSRALAVPYGNLAAMHEQLGNHQRARQYVELVSAHEPITD